MKQTVLIGLGGTGSRVVNHVTKLLRKDGVKINDGVITCMVLDTNQSDNSKIKKTGTKIPVVATCDERTIDAYLDNMITSDPLSWCPYNSYFGSESMIDGASAVRVKSRLAFSDVLDSSKRYELEGTLEKVFHKRPGKAEKVRVLLVSSLAGGTGSGMYIQTALWLRKFFAERNCQMTLRGVFLLPDIFVRTVENIRNNANLRNRNYANAYASIRELNAINKVLKGKIQLEKPIVIDDLFDSRKIPQHIDGKPLEGLEAFEKKDRDVIARQVFDNAFFIDDLDARGAALTDQSDYEEHVGQMVYMQLFAPMQDELVSVEDNLFSVFNSCTEPVYGSCGTARAEYPVEDVLHYCALRAAKQSIDEGWNKIDAEIDVLIQQENEERREGVMVEKPINRRDKFIELFEEKINKKGTKRNAGEQLFYTIKDDVFKLGGVEDEDADLPENPDQASVYIHYLTKAIENLVEQSGGLNDIRRVGDELKDPNKPKQFTKDEPKNLANVDKTELDVIISVLDKFDKEKDSLAQKIIRSFVPMDMSNVNVADEASLYSLFIQEDPNGGRYFIHPVAAKYLAYKLQKVIEIKQSELNVEKDRKAALMRSKTSFDIEWTLREETREEYWSQTGMITTKGDIAHYIRQFKKFNAANAMLCKNYEVTALTQVVLRELSELAKSMVEQIEALFRGLPQLCQNLEDELQANVERNTQAMEKVMYVYATQDHKDAVYKNLILKMDERNEDLNKTVINTLYGKFCAAQRPLIKANKSYADASAAALLKDHLVESFERSIMKDNEATVDLSIIQAIRNEIRHAAAHGGTEITEDEAVRDYLVNLENKASHFLQAEPDEKGLLGSKAGQQRIITTDKGKQILVRNQTELTFWGFHPKAVEEYPDIESDVGANKSTAADEGYHKNVIYCYKAIYGVIAEKIRKFHEDTVDGYYDYYSALINKMLGQYGSEVDTPHIDKTWHEFLPYIGQDQQANAQSKFYKTLWLAVAYTWLEPDLKGKCFEIEIKRKDAYGEETREPVRRLQESGKVIEITDVIRLVKALRNDPQFNGPMAKELEEIFCKDIEGKARYIDTRVIPGLVNAKELNPVTMIVRYAMAKGADPAVKQGLMDGLNMVLREVAANYHMNHTEEEVESAKVRLRNRIFEKCEMAHKHSKLQEWDPDPKQAAAVTEEGTGAGEGDII